MNSTNIKYFNVKQKRIELILRLYLGVQQLLHRPYCILYILMLTATFMTAWNYRTDILPENIPSVLTSIYGYSISVLLILAYIILFLCLIKYFGVMAARNDENSLVVAFSSEDLRKGIPLLISKKRLKGTDIIVREFYSNISMNRWQALEEELSDALNVHFVPPSFAYGGNNHGKRIVIYTAPSRKNKVRGVLYDDDF